MDEQIGVLSPGVWEIRDLVEKFTGCAPVRWFPIFKQQQFDSVVGWGFKATSNRARRLAGKTNSAYVAMEDGFIRSISPGPSETPVSLVVDRSGIYYDATGASDLEKLIVSNAAVNDPALLQRAKNGMRILRENKISKYNHAPFLTPDEMQFDQTSAKTRVLVVDQTYGDCSVRFGLADAKSFDRMLSCAVAENPDAEIIVKTHPEVVSGRKKGYLSNLDSSKVKLISHDVNPWSLIEAVEKVYVVTSQLGFEALLAGRKVVCFGAPFYSGWGLTDDRVTTFRRRKASPTLEQLFVAVYLDYARYISPDTRAEVSFEDAVGWLTRERNVFFSKQKLDVN